MDVEGLVHVNGTIISNEYAIRGINCKTSPLNNNTLYYIFIALQHNIMSK